MSAGWTGGVPGCAGERYGPVAPGVQRATAGGRAAEPDGGCTREPIGAEPDFSEPGGHYWGVPRGAEMPLARGTTRRT
jgi:hypothetical protein